MFFGLESLLVEIRRQLGKIGSDHHEIGIQRIYWLNEAIDGQSVDQAIRSEGFAGFDHPRKVRRASLRYQLVCFQCSHSFALYNCAPGNR